jgi:hypothetical protein
MNSNFNIWRRIGGGYIVSEATLRKFARLIGTFSGNAPQISLTFRDGRTINSTKPDEVFDDSFIRSTSISQITISTDYRSSQRATVEFRRDDSSPINFTANGDRQFSHSKAISSMNLHQQKHGIVD